MKIIFKSVAAAVLLMFLISAAVFFLLPLKGQVPVLMYHFVVPSEKVGPTTLDISQEDFERQMRFLKQAGFKVVPMKRLNQILKGEASPRWREVVVTFDDGNETFIDYALPILEKYQIPATNFVIFDSLVRKVHGSMSLEDAKKLTKNPLVTLGSHTLTHQTLTQIDDSKAKMEIAESKARLEETLGVEVRFLSYPTGAFDRRSEQFAKEAGYDLAFTTNVTNLIDNRVTYYSVPRIKISPNDNLFIFWLKASGLSSFGEQLRAAFKQKFSA